MTVVWEIIAVPVAKELKLRSEVELRKQTRNAVVVLVDFFSE